MSFVTAALIGGGATLASGLMGAQAAKDSAKIQAKSADRVTALQREMFEKQLEMQKPWQEAGEQALNKLIPLTDYTAFGMDQFQADPGYAFRLSEGMKGLERSAAARGGLLSGAALKGIQRYGQDMPRKSTPMRLTAIKRSVKLDWVRCSRWLVLVKQPHSKSVRPVKTTQQMQAKP